MKTFLTTIAVICFLGTSFSFAQDAADSPKTPSIQQVDEQGRIVQKTVPVKADKVVRTTEVKTVKTVQADTDVAKTKTITKSESVSKSKKSCSGHSKKSCAASCSKACCKGNKSSKAGCSHSAKSASAVKPTMAAPKTTENNGRADDKQ